MRTKEFNEIKPYTYFIVRKSDGKKYHGVRYRNKVSPLKDLGIGISFIIKNTIIILAIIIYLIFIFMLNKSKPSKSKEPLVKSNNNERVNNLDFLLEKDKLQSKKEDN